MATIRATAARVPNRKRKRGPPAIKVPKGSNYSRVASKSPNVSDDARKISKEAEASEEAKPMECPRAGKIPNGNETLEAIQASRVAKMVEVTQAPELTNTPEAETTEAKTSEATKSPEVIETYEIIKRCAAVDGPDYAYSIPHDTVASDDGEIFGLEYEGGNSFNQTEEADASFGDDEAVRESDNEDEDAYEDGLEEAFEALTTTHGYNNADEEEKKNAGDNKKDDGNKENAASVNGMPRPGKKRPSAKAKGIVRTVEDGEDLKLEWLNPQNRTWEPAVYHQEIREELIQDAAHTGSYRYPMAQGKHGRLDVTAFHPAFEKYGAEREHWPEILFKYLPNESDLMHVKPERWYLHDGRVVVDLNDDAMYDYAELPVTLASNADPWLLLTCMRMNNTISLQDLRGRMMGDQKRDHTDPMGRNRISMNMQRFRKFACCLTWNTIRVVDVQRDYLEEKLPRRCIRENSTKSFRMLFGWEVAELDTKDAGRHLNRTRAKNKDLSQAKSEAVYQQKLAISKAMKEQFEEKHPGGLPDDYDLEDEEYHAQQADTQEALEAIVADIKKFADNSNNEAVDMSVEEVKGGPEVEPVKRKGRKRQKVEPPKRDHKRRYILPDKDSSRKNRELVKCPQRHRNYAGFLTTAPQNVEEAQRLHDLLKPTRHHFKICTGLYPPRTEADECYKCQHGAIQDALIQWQSCVTKENGEKVPVVKLIGIRYIDEQMLYWNERWNFVWYGEAPGPDVLEQHQTDGEYFW